MADKGWQNMLKKKYSSCRSTPWRDAKDLPSYIFEHIEHILEIHPEAQQTTTTTTTTTIATTTTTPTTTTPEMEITDAETPDSEAPARLIPAHGPHQCHLCWKEFATNKGLMVHKRLKHHVFPPIVLRLRSNECPGCSAQLKSRSQALQHVQGRLSCALHVMQVCEPMSTAEYLAQVPTLNRTDTSLTRSRIPRTGPITALGSEAVAPINPYDSQTPDVPSFH
eukprot:6477704-Amphidinium_carterae.2